MGSARSPLNIRSAQSRRRRTALLVAVIVIVGLFLRLLGIDQKLVWHDEIYTQLFAAGTHAREWRSEIYTGRVIPVEAVQALALNRPDRSVLDTIQGLAADEPQHPPVYYIIARICVSLFGDSSGVLRRLSALFGLAAIPAMFWFCREAFRSRHAALAGAALISVSPFFVLYSQEARQYSLWGALIIASNAALLRALRRTESAGLSRAPRDRNAWLCFAIFTALALYTSFSTVVVVFAQALFILVREGPRITPVNIRAFASFALSGLAFAPWAWLLLQNLDSFAASMAWSRITVIPRGELLATLALNMGRVLWNGAPDPASNFDLSQNLPTIFGLIPSVLVIGAALLAMARRASARGRRPARGPEQSGVLVLILFCVPIVTLLGPDLLFGGIRSISGRYLTPAWFAMLAAIAAFTSKSSDDGIAAGSRERGASSGPKEEVLRRVALSAILAAGFLTCLLNAQRFTPWTKGISMQLPEVAALVNAADKPLVIGDFERHHPGNLLALSRLLKPETRMQFLAKHEPRYRLPPGILNVFLYSPIPGFRESLRDARGRKVRVEKLIDGLYLDLWRVRFADE